MKKVEVYYCTEPTESGMAIRIKDKSATVQDLLDAWQPLCDDETVYKSYAPDNFSVCRGCLINCCNTAYVMPDLIAFKKMAAHLNLDYHDFLTGYFQSDKRAAGLLKMKSPCIFLQDNICTIYTIRALICRFYICTQLMGTAEQFIYSIAWTGTAAALLFARQNELLPDDETAARSSMDQMFIRLLQEYQNNPNVLLFFQADDYNEIPLLPFLDDYTAEIAADIL